MDRDHIVLSVLIAALAFSIVLMFVYNLQLDRIAVSGAGDASPKLPPEHTIIPFPMRIYTLVLNGAGTTATTLSLNRDSESLKLRSDVADGIVTYLMIKGHPYKIKYDHETKYYMKFSIVDACREFPFPECSTSDAVTDIVSTVVHALGYNPN